MKKILILITAGAMALGALQEARADISTIRFNSASADIAFVTSGYDLLSTTLGGNYVVTFWYAETQTIVDGWNINLKPIGITGFESGGDLEGMFDLWGSNPAMPLDLVSGQPGFLGIRIFELGDMHAKSFADDDAWWDYFEGLKGPGVVTSPTMAGMIEDMFKYKAAFSEYGEWIGSFNADSDGGVPGSNAIYYIDFGLPGGVGSAGTVMLDKIAGIPEPSTWLLLGAGAAFIVILRRRKKAE